MAGSELVRWHLVAMRPEGPYQLTLQHGRGSIVEYFTTTDAALQREQELERLLVGAREDDDVDDLPPAA